MSVVPHRGVQAASRCEITPFWMVWSPSFFMYTMSSPTGKVSASRRRPSRARRLLAVSWATLLVSKYASAVSQEEVLHLSKIRTIAA